MTARVRGRDPLPPHPNPPVEPPIALGLVWLGAAMRPAAARLVNVVFGVTLLAVGVVGMTEMLDELLNITEATDPDNWLHLGTGALSLLFGLWAVPRARARTARSS